MNLPDYLSPIVAYRVWFWNNPSLASGTAVLWPPGQPLQARCAVCQPGIPRYDRSEQEMIRDHEAPQRTCSCGIYATKYPDPLYGMGRRQLVIAGEVFLWGSVVEHQLGWRAQFAYPKSLILTREMIPYGAKNAETAPEIQ
jgi:hypothetical protein